MSFWIFMGCIALALLLGASLERAKTKIKTKTSKNKVYEYSCVGFKTIDIPRAAMKELVRVRDQNGVIRVYDYYLICGVGANLEDAKYGWKDITGFKIEQHEQGYALHVPTPILLEK